MRETSTGGSCYYIEIVRLCLNSSCQTAAQFACALQYVGVGALLPFHRRIHHLHFHTFVVFLQNLNGLTSPRETAESRQHMIANFTAAETLHHIVDNGEKFAVVSRSANGQTFVAEDVAENIGRLRHTQIVNHYLAHACFRCSCGNSLSHALRVAIHRPRRRYSSMMVEICSVQTGP